MEDNASKKGESISLSPISQALVSTLKTIKPKTLPDDYTRISVSRAVSILAIAYEKIRNAIEYREEHLLRRAAIERILRRRLSMNPLGEGEAENLLRELLWARYFPKGSLGEADLEATQEVINIYLRLQDKVIRDLPYAQIEPTKGTIMEMMTCEIERRLASDTAERLTSYTYFIFQTIHNTVKIDGVPDNVKDTYLTVAIERSYRKSDRPFQRYHFFLLLYKPLYECTQEEREYIAARFPDIIKKIDDTIRHPYVNRLSRFMKKQLAAYLILFDVIDSNPENYEQVLTNKTLLWQKVEAKCKERYKEIQSKMTGLAVRSLIYIFITKMIFAIILEVPVSLWIYGEIPYLAITVNALFPPLLMLMIVLWYRLPGKENTRRIYERIVDLINIDPTFENKVALIARKRRKRGGLMLTFFTLVYGLTYFITFALIYYVLSLIGFHLLSMLLFVFFISLVSFFSYRIKQVVKEYWLIERDSLLAPVTNFFFLPILSVGRFFNSGVSKLNFFTIVFDIIIEAPFKFLIDIIEEWNSFMKARKEEIV